MVRVFQLKTKISFKGLSCLHCGQFIWAMRKNNQPLKPAQSKPRMIPDKKISKVNIIVE